MKVDIRVTKIKCAFKTKYGDIRTSLILFNSSLEYILHKISIEDLFRRDFLSEEDEIIYMDSPQKRIFAIDLSRENDIYSQFNPKLFEEDLAINFKETRIDGYVWTKIIEGDI